MPQVRAKSVVSSKTAWLGIAVAALAVLEAVVGLVDTIGVEWPWLMGAIGAAIVVLRLLTDRPVTVTGGDLKDVDP